MNRITICVATTFLACGGGKKQVEVPPLYDDKKGKPGKALACGTIDAVGSGS